MLPGVSSNGSLSGLSTLSSLPHSSAPAPAAPAPAPAAAQHQQQQQQQQAPSVQQQQSPPQQATPGQQPADWANSAGMQQQLQAAGLPVISMPQIGQPGMQMAPGGLNAMPNYGNVPTAMMANVNGVPTLVQVMPQQMMMLQGGGGLGQMQSLMIGANGQVMNQQPGGIQQPAGVPPAGMQQPGQGPMVNGGLGLGGGALNGQNMGMGSGLPQMGAMNGGMAPPLGGSNGQQYAMLGSGMAPQYAHMGQQVGGGIGGGGVAQPSGYPGGWGEHASPQGLGGHPGEGRHAGLDARRNGGRDGHYDARGGGRNAGGDDRGGHGKKVLMCKGREVRSVEEAAALGGLLELAHDQNGCRYLQDQLDLRVKAHIDAVFDAVSIDVVPLSMDPFGNYLIQKLVQYGTVEQRVSLVGGASPSLIAIALNVHGTRVVQKMIEVADTEEQLDMLIGTMGPRVMELILDMNGNHVVQRCLASLSPARASFIYEAVRNETVRVSTHRHGCCVLQRSLDHAPEEHRNPIIGMVVHNAKKLVLDPFGNYVVQYVLELKRGELTRGIAQALQGSFAELSLQKFSSNVIEKCLQAGDPMVVSIVTREITAAKSLGQLLHDPFANYVVQTRKPSTADRPTCRAPRLTPSSVVRVARSAHRG